MSPEFRGEGPARDTNVGGVNWFGNSFPNYFIPGTDPAPSRRVRCSLPGAPGPPALSLQPGSWAGWQALCL